MEKFEFKTRQELMALISVMPFDIQRKFMFNIMTKHKTIDVYKVKLLSLTQTLSRMLIDDEKSPQLSSFKDEIMKMINKLKTDRIIKEEEARFIISAFEKQDDPDKIVSDYFRVQFEHRIQSSKNFDTAQDAYDYIEGGQI